MKTIHRNRSGSSLIIVLSVLATLMVVVAVAAEYTTTVNRHVARSNTEQSAIAVGDSCIEILFANWRKLCSATPTTAQTSNTFATIPLPTNTQLNLPSATNFAKRDTTANWFDPASDHYDPTYTISNYKVVAVNAQWSTLAAASSTPEPMLGQIASAITSTSVTPTTSLVYNYVASADVTLPAMGPDGKMVARVRRVFQKQQLSPWNFAIFYVDPLEIHPGPLFTVTGWVHTNSDLYTGHNTLTFADKVTYASDWFVDFMPGETSHDGETPAAPNYPSNLPPARDQAQQPFGMDSTSIFSTTDPNPNNDSYRELIEPPKAGFTDPLASQRYWDQASVVIEVRDNPSSTSPGFDGVNGHDLVTIGTPNVDGTITALSTSTDLYKMFKDAITTNEVIQDNREAASIRLATLDIKNIESSTGLNPTYKADVADGWNGIVYMYNKSATSSARRGIRLKNGSRIPNKRPAGEINGLTVASNNPVYIQGDFNSGRDYDGSPAPPSNSGDEDDATMPQVSGYNGITNSATANGRAPCSVLADAVTILSNNWSDSNAASGDPLSARQATNTTVNTAIIAGIVPSSPVGGDGSYSGGAENFPRFLEIWGGDNTLTYHGSMIELYKSQQSMGKWGSANVYDPPKRQWFFDTNFKVTPPPGSLMLYSYIKGKWSLL